MASKYFVFLYPEVGRTKKLLDLMIYVLDPMEKWPAHITVAGPFKDRRSLRITAREYQSSVHVYGSADFFAHGAPTVYLNVGFQELDSIWRKPYFKSNPIPHLTVYNGNDMKFAQKVAKLLRQHRHNFMFETRGLHVVESISGQYRSDLKMAVDFEVLESTRHLSHDEVRSLPNRDRLNIAQQALEALPVTQFPIAI